MKRKLLGLGLLMAGMVLVGGCGSSNKDSAKEARVRPYIHDTLTKLAKVGIDYTELEDTMVTELSVFPEDILANSPEQLLTGIVFNYLGNTEYLKGKGINSQQLDQFYAFDMEVFDVNQMYSVFLQKLVTLSNGELQISDITEDFSGVDLDAGTGTEVVRFVCNGKSYEYSAKFYYDWFDPKIVVFMNEILAEQQLDKRLYATTDGYQSLILFYQTIEWAEAFNQAFAPDFQLSE